MNATISAEQLLQAIDPASLTYEEWINVGKACKHEGLSLGAWAAWSAQDPARYKPGECEYKWGTFNGTGVTAGTLFHLAQQQGTLPAKDVFLNWNDTIRCETAPTRSGAAQLVEYLQTLFQSGDVIAYTLNSQVDDKGKHKPDGKGAYTRTAGDVIAALKEHDDITQALGTYQEQAGAWIRLNPMDGKGIADANVVKFHHVLIESDTTPVDHQEHVIRELRLPCAAIVLSGGKSVHAVVRVDAADSKQYRERAQYIADVCKKHGLEVDTQNFNPSRLSRMPGVMRNGQQQRLLGVNIGLPTFDAWKQHIEHKRSLLNHRNPLQAGPTPPPIFEGGPARKTLGEVVGIDGIGKSYLLYHLALNIATPSGVMDALRRVDTQPERVLYVGYEDAEEITRDRLQAIGWATGKQREINAAIDNTLFFYYPENFLFDVSLDGRLIKETPLFFDLENAIVEHNPALVIIDPYSSISCAEENANGLGAQMGQILGNLARNRNVAILIAHHTAKGRENDKSHHSARGNTGFVSKCRWLLRVTKDEGKELITCTFAKDSYHKRAAEVVLTRTDAGTFEVAATAGDDDRRRMVCMVVEFIRDHPELQIAPYGIGRNPSRDTQRLIDHVGVPAREVVDLVKQALFENQLYTVSAAARNGKTREILRYTDGSSNNENKLF